MNDYEMAKNAQCAVSPMQEKTVDRLRRTKKYLLDQVADIDEALVLLEKYPDIEKLTDLLRRI